jgi:hypothetical protein
MLASEISGAPRPMKMGTTASPCRYDAGAFHTLQLIILRMPAILRSARFVERLSDVVRVVMRVTSRFTVCRSNTFSGVKRQRGT